MTYALDITTADLVTATLYDVESGHTFASSDVVRYGYSWGDPGQNPVPSADEISEATAGDIARSEWSRVAETDEGDRYVPVRRVGRRRDGLMVWDPEQETWWQVGILVRHAEAIAIAARLEERALDSLGDDR